MAKTKAITAINSMEELAQLKENLKRQLKEADAREEELLRESYSVVGEVAMGTLKNVPKVKAECKNYFAGVQALIDAHASEFQKLLTGKASPVQKERIQNDLVQEEPAQVENFGNVRLPNDARIAQEPVEASVDAEAGE
jgi:hypothetical protein